MLEIPPPETVMIRDTGSPRADAEADFLRARRLQVIAALTARLLGKQGGFGLGGARRAWDRAGGSGRHGT